MMENNPADSYGSIRSPPSKSAVFMDKAQDCVYSGSKDVFQYTACHTVRDFKKDSVEETEWRAQVNPRTDYETKRRDSSVSSVSLRSNSSIQIRPNISEEPPSESSSREQAERRESSVSYVSLRSDGSIQMPLNIIKEHVPAETIRKGKERIRRWNRVGSLPKSNPPLSPEPRREQSSQKPTLIRTSPFPVKDGIDSYSVQTTVDHCHISLSTDRRDSSTSSTLSEQSEITVDQTHIKYGAVCSINRPSSPGRLSVKSEASLDIALAVSVRQEDAHTNQRCLWDSESVMTDASLDNIVHFRHQRKACTAAARARPCSPGCVSVASEASLDHIVHLGQTGKPAQRACSPGCVSVTSEASLDHIVHFGQARQHAHSARPCSPGCVSVASDASLDHIVHFGQARQRAHRARPYSLDCISVASEASLDHIVHLGQAGKPAQSARPCSPGCVSVTSEASLDHIVHFGQARQLAHSARPCSPGCVSVASEASLDHIVHFGQARQRAHRARPCSPGCVSVASDASLDHIVHLGQARQHALEIVQVEECPSKIERLTVPYGNRLSMYRPHSPSPSHASTDSDSYQEWLPSSPDQSVPSPSRQTGKQDSLIRDENLTSECSIHMPQNTSEETASTTRSKSIQQCITDKLGDIQVAIEGHKASLKKRFEVVPAESTKLKGDVPFHAIYTELQLMVGVSQQINVEHEVQQIEMMRRGHAEQTHEIINSSDLFKPLRRDQISIRTVLTKGIAGIGKTMYVQKFVLDWAEGLANQDLDLVFVLPFRELNLVISKHYSLHSLLLELFEDLRILDGLKVYQECKLLFILDGLDESRLRLDFQCKRVCDTNQAVSVSELVTNLIRGELLPMSLVWVTSRPAAACEIPVQYIDQVTELRGFSETQKEDFIRRKVDNQTVANDILAHIRATRSLHIMCYIPVFCALITTVFQKILDKKKSTKDIPSNMTEVFTEFITTLGNNTHQQLQEAKGERVCKLAKLAFTHLQKQQFTFYEDELRECGINTSNSPVFSGLCVEILKEEAITRGQRTYSFLHLTIQEFLAAFHVIHSFLAKNTGALETLKVPVSDKSTDLYDLLKGAVDRSLQDEYGHLDIFLRFLLGLSLRPNQKFFQSLLKNKQSVDLKTKITENIDQLSKDQTRKKIIAYIKNLRKEENLSPERCINLFHCLLEMGDFTMQEEIKEYLRSADRSPRLLSPAHCSALAYILLMSQTELEELDLMQYNTTDEGRIRLLPAVRWCRKARLDGCKLPPRAYQTVALSLQSLGSPLTELDLSYNCLEDSGLEELAKGLLSPHCKLKTLSLVGCDLTELSCMTMASVLQLHHSPLRELNLSDNELCDSGMEHLASGMQSPTCKIQILRLSVCGVSAKGCAELAAAVNLNPTHLKELDLSYNYPKSTGVEQLSAKHQDPDCALETLNVRHGGWYRLLSTPKKYFCKLHLDPMTAHRNLALSDRNRQVMRGAARPSTGEPEPPERFDFWPQVLCREPLTGRCYWEVEWSATATIGLTSRGILSKRGKGDDGLLGNYPKSLALYCDEGSYSVHHSKKKIQIDFPPFECRRVGVFLDWPNGSVSFYRVSPDRMLPLRTLYTNFTEPLYAAFTVHSPDTVISLCGIQTP